MSLQTYTDLQAAIPNWLARIGDPVIVSNAADFITLCEARIAYGSGEKSDPDSFYSMPLRVRGMERSYVIPIGAVTPISTVAGTPNAITLTPSNAIAGYAIGQTWQFTALSSIVAGGVTASISGLPARAILKGSGLAALGVGDIVIGQGVQLYDDGTELVLLPGTANAPLPPNYLAQRNAYLDTNPRLSLTYTPPGQANLSFAPGDVGPPSKYTIEGDALRFNRAPEQTYNMVMLYYQKLGALSVATNWLMMNAPNVYLFGSLTEACIFLDDDAGAQKYVKLYRSACNALQLQDVVDRHSGAPLMIQNDTGNP